MVSKRLRYSFWQLIIHQDEGRTHIGEKWWDYVRPGLSHSCWLAFWCQALAVFLWSPHIAAMQTKTVMAASSQGCFIVNTLLWKFFWQNFDFTVLHHKMQFLLDFLCLKVPEMEESEAQLLLQILTFTSHKRIPVSWAPQNLKKGEDGLLDEDILWNQGQKEEMS